MPSTEMMEIIMPAIFVGIMVALTHAPLGLEVLRRGIIFIDLAIAQIAALGLVAVGNMGEMPQWAGQVAAVIFALLAALLFRFTEKKMPQEQEALIGCSFIIAASLAFLLLADNPHGSEEMEHILSGQILFVTWREAFVHLPVYVLVLLLWFLRPQTRSGVWFYVLFALAITSSVQLVGVYLVFASLILPALAVINAEKYMIAKAWACGIISVLAGIAVSTMYDLPAGPLIVCSYGITALAYRIFRLN